MRYFNSTTLLANRRLVLCACIMLAAATTLAVAQALANDKPATTSVDAKPILEPEVTSNSSEAALNDTYIHFWNRSGGFVRDVSIRISYRSKTGKRHSYRFSDNGKRHGRDYDAIIQAESIFKIRICDGCTDFKIESWVMNNQFVYNLFKANPTWGSHHERTDISTVVNSYWYVDKHSNLIKNNNISSYSLFELTGAYADHFINMWTGVRNGATVCQIGELPYD